MVYVGHIMAVLYCRTHVDYCACYPVLLLLITSTKKLESQLCGKPNVIIDFLQIFESL